MNLKELRNRALEIAREAENATGETLADLMSEMEEISAKITEAENRRRLAESAKTISEGKNAEITDDDEATERGEILAKGGNIKIGLTAANNAVGSSVTVLPRHTSETVNDTFNEVSSLIDGVKFIPLDGGESFKQGFVKGYSEGDYTKEGAAYGEGEPTFGYAQINKTKITSYSEINEEVEKLAPAAYSNIVENGITIAIRKKLSRQILIGDGADGHFVGIFHNPTKTSDDIIDRSTDIAISTIDADTLDNIVYSFGGEEDVEATAVLILHKADLAKFAKVRKTNGEKAYTIVNHGNRGTINSVPYIINSACKAISNAATAENDYCMAYGPLSNYTVAGFSPLTVKKSEHYKFKNGQIAFKGDVFAGGNVTAYNGFIRVKKAANEVVGDE